ncbi:hypothetical protein EVAR_58916_1 [Eumeta japonica]|uniref:Uncharacterized protein n=1 Tax=Eumeta variegata TaxID=151549 RepID=A0A4C1YA04_EUMVA|nr:hypothetical protein EVAR_58916_1 [Eumeta japonica]
MLKQNRTSSASAPLTCRPVLVDVAGCSSLDVGKVQSKTSRARSPRGRRPPYFVTPRRRRGECGLTTSSRFLSKIVHLDEIAVL